MEQRWSLTSLSQQTVCITCTGIGVPSEFQTSGRAERKAMEAFEMWGYRRMLRVRWEDRVTNKESSDFISDNSPDASMMFSKRPCQLLPLECSKPQQISLSNHLLICSGKQPSNCGETIEADDATAKSNAVPLVVGGMGQDHRHICSICKKSFLEFSYLKEHFLLHTERNRACSLPKNLSAAWHDGTSGKCHLCNMCGKQFSHHWNLKQHLLAHSGDKPHTCGVCNRNFSQISHLKQHVQTHTEGKPHVCDTCNKTFIHGSHLKRHQLRHSSDKPLVCRECGKPFSEGSDLKRHLLTHTGEKPHRCKICQKTFSQGSNLKQHLLTHTGEKPHMCKVCQKAFSHGSHLSRHLRMHTGQKPHVCQCCSKRYTDRSSLQKHVRTHLAI